MIEELDKNNDSNQIKDSSERLAAENSHQDGELKRKKKSGQNQVIRSIGYITQIGITIAATIMLGVFLGRILDNWLGTSPWLLLFFSLLGMAAAIKALFEMSNTKK
ncbi:MAG TPA: AtpZ/AtpI family protein [Bacillota bacterium]|nr:AtpZ/AtpI family protein [Bacillota bacterium]